MRFYCHLNWCYLISKTLVFSDCFQVFSVSFFRSVITMNLGAAFFWVYLFGISSASSIRAFIALFWSAWFVWGHWSSADPSSGSLWRQRASLPATCRGEALLLMSGLLLSSGGGRVSLTYKTEQLMVRHPCWCQQVTSSSRWQKWPPFCPEDKGHFPGQCFPAAGVSRWGRGVWPTDSVPSVQAPVAEYPVGAVELLGVSGGRRRPLVSSAPMNPPAPTQYSWWDSLSVWWSYEPRSVHLPLGRGPGAWALGCFWSQAAVLLQSQGP